MRVFLPLAELLNFDDRDRGNPAAEGVVKRLEAPFVDELPLGSHELLASIKHAGTCNQQPVLHVCARRLARRQSIRPTCAAREVLSARSRYASTRATASSSLPGMRWP